MSLPAQTSSWSLEARQAEPRINRGTVFKSSRHIHQCPLDSYARIGQVHARFMNHTRNSFDKWRPMNLEIGVNRACQRCRKEGGYAHENVRCLCIGVRADSWLATEDSLMKEKAFFWIGSCEGSLKNFKNQLLVYKGHNMHIWRKLQILLNTCTCGSK